MKLIIKIKEIRGNCPVYKEGDKIVLEEGYKLSTKDSSSYICMHSLASLMPYYVALSRGVDPKSLGLAKEGKKAYIQCLDPRDYTNGGTVIMEVEVLE